MIKLKEEDKEYYEQFRVYERCHFCNIETKYWHERTNTPVCQDCAKIKKVKDIKK